MKNKALVIVPMAPMFVNVPNCFIFPRNIQATKISLKCMFLGKRSIGERNRLKNFKIYL
jgi:hypothetical protein